MLEKMHNGWEHEFGPSTAQGPEIAEHVLFDLDWVATQAIGYRIKQAEITSSLVTDPSASCSLPGRC